MRDYLFLYYAFNQPIPFGLSIKLFGILLKVDRKFTKSHICQWPITPKMECKLSKLNEIMIKKNREGERENVNGQKRINKKYVTWLAWEKNMPTMQ